MLMSTTFLHLFIELFKFMHLNFEITLFKNIVISDRNSMYENTRL